MAGDRFQNKTAPNESGAGKGKAPKEPPIFDFRIIPRFIILA
jgi:hypothetical protein